MNQTKAVELNMTPTAVVRRSLAILLGVLLVSLGAQAAIPVPGSPVPMTLQPAAVLIVGGMLGPRLGAASMVVYLLIGAAGLPVFAPTAVPGVARLFGPTGGYLLAFPVAAALVGVAARRGRTWFHLAAGLVAALLAVHLGGVTQLAILGGDLATAAALGSVPFLLGDLLEILVAGLLIGLYGSKLRALL